MIPSYTKLAFFIEFISTAQCIGITSTGYFIQRIWFILADTSFMYALLYVSLNSLAIVLGPTLYNSFGKLLQVMGLVYTGLYFFIWPSYAAI